MILLSVRFSSLSLPFSLSISHTPYKHTHTHTPRARLAAVACCVSPHTHTHAHTHTDNTPRTTSHASLPPLYYITTPARIHVLYHTPLHARTYICVCTRMLSSSFISSSTSFRPFLLTSPLTHPPSPDLETRVNDIASRIPMAELPNLFSDVTVGVPSLNIPQYNWWSEALHGTRRI